MCVFVRVCERFGYAIIVVGVGMKLWGLTCVCVRVCCLPWGGAQYLDHLHGYDGE